MQFVWHWPVLSIVNAIRMALACLEYCVMLWLYTYLYAHMQGSQLPADQTLYHDYFRKSRCEPLAILSYMLQ